MDVDVDADDARRIAEAELAQWNSALTPNRLTHPSATSHNPEDEWVVTGVESHSRAWVVQLATRRWVSTRSFSDETVGACPLVIDRATGELHSYGSGEYNKFATWLDEPPR